MDHNPFGGHSLSAAAKRLQDSKANTPSLQISPGRLGIPCHGHHQTTEDRVQCLQTSKPRQHSDTTP